MALTEDRTYSGWSAADLNALFEDLKAQLVATLPSSIATQCDNSIANIAISELDEIAAGIESPRDIAAAVAYLGSRLAEDCADEAEANGNSEWVFGYVPSDSLTGAQSWLVSVAQKATEQYLELEEAVADLGEDLREGSLLYGQVLDFVLQESYKDLAAQQQFYEQLFTIPNSQRTNFQQFSNTSAPVVQFQQQYANLGFQQAARAFSGAQFNRQPVSLLNGYNQTQISLVRNVGALNMQRTFTSGAVQPMSYSGGSTFSFSFTEEEVDGGLSDNFDLPLITREPFDGVGFNEWYPEPATGSALTTITIEYFEEDLSVTSFLPPPLFSLTSEPFSSGFSEGTQPASCGSGSTATGFETEDLSSQIDGSNTIFTLSKRFKSGTLRVYWNGQRQIVGDTITELNNTQFSTSFTAATGNAINADFSPDDCC